MKQLFAVILLSLASFGFGGSLDNNKLIGSVDTMSKDVSISVYADGSGLLAFVIGDSHTMNLRYDAASEFLQYIGRYEKFVDAVKNGNSGVKFDDYIGGRPFVPNLPYNSKVFVEASTMGTVESCAFSFRVVKFANNSGWGNEGNFSMTTAQVAILKDLIYTAKDEDSGIRTKIQNLRSLVEAPF